MNKSHIKFAHKAFQTFLMQPDDQFITQQVDALKQKDPCIDSIFQMIDHIRNVAGVLDIHKRKTYKRIRFSEIDQFISNALSNHLSKNEAQKLLNTLYFSPIMYDMFWQRVLLSFHSGDYAMAPEMSEVQIVSDEAMLTLIKKHTGKQRSWFDFLTDIKKRYSWKQPPRKSKVWAPAFSMAVAMLFVLIIWHPWPKEESIGFQIYKKNVPYVYNDSGMRAGVSIGPEDHTFGLFVYDYKMAMSDYVLDRYQNAIQQFSHLETQHQALIKDASDSVQIQWIREFYFYWGMSYLAFDQGVRINIENYKKSITHFKKALVLAERLQSNNTDRDYFYLGLACALDEQIEESIQFLKKIAPDTYFYLDAQAIIQSF